MTEQPHCPKCGTPLPAHAPAGLCPPCLIRAGLESEAEPFARPAATIPSPATARFEPLSVESLAGKFPQLEILELLGKGGMGAVYKARQRGLDRLVAVKVLPPEIGHDPAFAERFTREARALARLSHNHIVSVFDFGQSDGLFYIVMEYVDGVNLRQTIQTGKLTPAEALAIVPQICEALQFAHDEGIVHRDIKPENILIDKRGRVKIADFGLAKLLGQDTGDHMLTATHQIMGTLRYMAPEQMQGSREVDHRADIYSLGVIFYELLTGELPMGKFAPPSKKVQIDVRLDEIVLRALEQDPEQRYQHASEVRTDVQTVSSSTLASGQGQPRGSRNLATGWPAEHRSALASGSQTPSRSRSQLGFSTLFAATAIGSFLISLGGIACAIFPWGQIYNPTFKTWPSVAGVGWWQGILSGGLFAAVLLLLVSTVLLKPVPLWRPLLTFLAGIGAMVAVSSYLLEMNNGSLPVQPLLHSASMEISIEGKQATTINEAKVFAMACNSPYVTLALAASLLLVAAIELGAILKQRTSENSEVEKSVAGPVSVPKHEAVPESQRVEVAIDTNAARYLIVCGVLMILLGVLGATIGFIGVGAAGIVWSAQPETVPKVTNMLGFVGMIVLGSLVGDGGWCIIKRTSYHRALLASLLSLLLGLLMFGVQQNVLTILGFVPGVVALYFLLQPEIKAAFQARQRPKGTTTAVDEKTGTGPVSLSGTPVTQIRFAVDDSRDVAREAIFHFSTLGYQLIEQRPDACVFRRGGKWAGLWEMDVRGIYTILTVRTAPAAAGELWVSCDWSIRKLGNWITRRDIAKLEAEGRGLESLLNPKIEAKPVSLPLSGAPPSPTYPKLVPVLAAFNLVGAIVLMLACAMESPVAFAQPMPRLWQVWEQVDAVLGFVMAAGMFAASIGLFLWKPWARKLTLGVCIFGLASLVFDAPYLARFAIPDIYTDIEQAVIAEGIERDVRDFVTLATFLVVFGGLLVFGLTCLIGQIIYFTRPRVVAAFESQGEKHGKFSEWLFSGTGAVVGVISVFGPLALLLGIAALLNTGGKTTVTTTMEDPAAVPSLGIITSGIGVHFTVPAGQVAIFEIVTRRDNATVAIPNHCGYVMAAGKPLEASFLWSHAPRAVDVDGRKSWRIETRYAGGGGGSTEGFLLPEGLDAAVGSKSLGLGTLEPKTEIVSWCGNVDANKLPDTGLIGLRITVVPHGLNKSGSGEGHIDWKTQLPSSTTRRKLP